MPRSTDTTNPRRSVLAAAVALIVTSGCARQPCDKLTPAGCMDTATCVLDPPPRPAGEYVCREPRTACEQVAGTFAEDLQARCAARADCRFVAAECFCGPEIQGKGACVCGGGAPARCVAR